jgi:DNA-binding PadR family transcriptional regulator
MGGPKHAYSLYQDFRKAFNHIWKAGQANFYAALTGLEAKGYVASVAEPQESRPPRKVYQLTEVGQEAFLQWLRKPVSSLRAFRVELIAKLRFFHLLEIPGAAELIEQQLTLLRDMLDEWQQPPASENSQDLFPDLVDDFRRRQAGFLVEWLATWQNQFQDTSVH